MELKFEGQVRGTRLLFGPTAKRRRDILNTLTALADAARYEELSLPSLELADIYSSKAGEEVLGQMYTFPDKKNRELCLRPEGTATCQILADTIWKSTKDVRLWYATTCWRYERPQSGRYREFTQFGVEILNPRGNVREELIALAETMVSAFTKNFKIDKAAKRGLAYYVEEGFEISCPDLEAQKQICGGGAYKQGCGFAIGVDRLMLV